MVNPKTAPILVLSASIACAADSHSPTLVSEFGAMQRGQACRGADVCSRSEASAWSRVVWALSGHAAVRQQGRSDSAPGSSRQMTAVSPKRTQRSWLVPAIADIRCACLELVVCGTERQFAAVAPMAALCFLADYAFLHRREGHRQVIGVRGDESPAPGLKQPSAHA